jgi:hypothetical protein
MGIEGDLSNKIAPNPSFTNRGLNTYVQCFYKNVKTLGSLIFTKFNRLVWFGLVWFGLVWFGLVWFGLVTMV